MIERVSSLVADFPEISELDLNPVFATEHGATAADVRIVLDFNPAPARDRPDQADIVEKMNRIMKPKAVAVIGASAENGKIGNSVMKNLINGGYAGEIYPIHPVADSIMGKKAYKSVKDVPGDIDVAVFAIPAKFVAQALIEVGEKKIAGAILIPSGFAETGNVAGQNELIEIGRKYGVRLMGPNIYGFYYTPSNLCATFCTAYDVKGHAALSSQSGGIGMAIIGFSRSAKMGVSAIVGLGNKSDIDEDDLLTFFEQDENTTIIAQHLRGPEGWPLVRRGGQARLEEEADRGAEGRPHQHGRARGQFAYRRARRKRQDLRGCLQAIRRHPRPLAARPARIRAGHSGASHAEGQQCGDHHGRRRVGRAPVRCLRRQWPVPDGDAADLDAAFRKFIPPFGAAGNPVDITGGEPPSTYQNTVRLGLEDPRIHALILGYWHTIITPPMVFARLMVEVVAEMRAKGIEKPVVASLAGDVEVEEAAEYLYQHGIPAYAYSTEIPVAVLGAKYKWARGAGLIPQLKRELWDGRRTSQTAAQPAGMIAAEEKQEGDWPCCRGVCNRPREGASGFASQVRPV